MERHSAYNCGTSGCRCPMLNSFHVLSQELSKAWCGVKGDQRPQILSVTSPTFMLELQHSCRKQTQDPRSPKQCRPCCFSAICSGHPAPTRPKRRLGSHGRSGHAPHEQLSN
eukprot:111342-Amphidinium_carterae.1